MIYPVVLHKDRTSDYGVTVPDLPGCFSAGRTIDEALEATREAIELHLEGLIDAGQPIPAPGSIESHQAHPDYRDGTWALVPVDESSLRVKVVRINITLPERVLDAVDQYAQRTGESRSVVFSQAAAALIGRDDLPTAKRGRRPDRRRSPAVAEPQPVPRSTKTAAGRRK